MVCRYLEASRAGEWRENTDKKGNIGCFVGIWKRRERVNGGKTPTRKAILVVLSVFERIARLRQERGSKG